MAEVLKIHKHVHRRTSSHRQRQRHVVVTSPELGMEALRRPCTAVNENSKTDKRDYAHVRPRYARAPKCTRSRLPIQ
jgi:hypothetical protein